MGEVCLTLMEHGNESLKDEAQEPAEEDTKSFRGVGHGVVRGGG